MKQRNTNEKSTTLSWAVALVVVLIAAVSAAFLLQKGDATGKIARIYQDGILVREIDLSSVESSYEFTVETESGFNVIAVRSNGICVSEADCGDQTCVHQGWLSGGVAPIVCLPHKLIIQLEDLDPSDALDAISGSIGQGG